MHYKSPKLVVELVLRETPEPMLDMVNFGISGGTQESCGQLQDRDINSAVAILLLKLRAHWPVKRFHVKAKKPDSFVSKVLNARKNAGDGQTGLKGLRAPSDGAANERPSRFLHLFRQITEDNHGLAVNIGSLERLTVKLEGEELDSTRLESIVQKIAMNAGWEFADYDFDHPSALSTVDTQKSTRRPLPQTPLAKSETWSADLLATELMFPKHGKHPPNPKAFYEGWPITASELDSGYDVRRVFSSQNETLSYDDLVKKRILPQLREAGVGRKVPVFLLTGAGGAGKSVVMERLGFDLSKVEQPKVIVLRLPKESVLDAKDFQHDYYKTINDAKAKVVALFIDEASHSASGIQALLDLARREHFRLCIFLADQPNKRDQLPREADEFSLGKLTDQEIHGLLALLEKTNNLGVLKYKSVSERFEFFKTFADKQLLVALREATTGKRFDAIIQDEWERIPSDNGKRLYELVALLHSFGQGFYLPEEAARRLLKCNNDQPTWRQARDSCREILQSSQVRAPGMTTAWRARHGIVAEIIFRHRYQRGSPLENANDFAQDAAEIVYALHDLQDDANWQTVSRLAQNFVRHELFAERVAEANSFKELANAFSYFDEKRNDVHNNFMSAAGYAWRNSGSVEASIGLLTQAISLGRQECASLPACCEELAISLLETRATERLTDGISILTQQWKEFAQVEVLSCRIASGLSLLYEFRNAEGDLDSAISILEEQLSHSGLGDKIRIGLRLSGLLVKRNHGADKQRALEVIKDLTLAKPPLPNRGKALIRLSDLLADVDTEVTPAQRRKNLTNAIKILDEVLAESETLPDWEDVVVHQAKLLQERSDPGDIARALGLIEVALKKRPRPISPTMLLIRLSHLLQAEDQEGGLDKAIGRIRDGFSAFGIWPDANMLRIQLSALLIRRYGNNNQQQDFDDAIAELKIAVNAPETVQNPTRTALRLCKLLVLHRGKRGLDEAITILTEAAPKKYLRRGRGVLLWKLFTLLKQRNAKGDSEKAVAVIKEAQKCQNAPSIAARIDAELATIG